MTWTTPKTWVTGDILTAADLNTYVRDNTSDLDTRITALDAEIATVSSAPILKGSDTTEGTTTQTGSGADLRTISGLSIPTTSGIKVAFSFRKSTGAAAGITALYVKLNTTSSGIWVFPTPTDTANAAGNGYAILEVPPYLSTSYDDAAWGGSQFTNTSGTDTHKNAEQVAARPNATITAVVIQGQVDSSSITCGVQGIRVYEMAA